MQITDALLGEHGAFYAQFNHLENLVPDVSDAATVRALGAALGASLASHAGLENDLLLTALEQSEAPAGPVMAMRQDHDAIESLLERLPNESEITAARDTLLECIGLARDHFAREEHVLFPLASRVLNAERLEALGAVWADRRSVVIG